MSPRPRYDDVDAYIADAAPAARGILESIRTLIKSRVPDAAETISYQMPAFKRKRVFIYYAAFKNHIGIYPPARGDAALDKALAPYRGEKGNLKFPLDEPMPYELIGHVVDALAEQHAR